MKDSLDFTCLPTTKVEELCKFVSGWTVPRLAELCRAELARWWQVGLLGWKLMLWCCQWCFANSKLKANWTIKNQWLLSSCSRPEFYFAQTLNQSRNAILWSCRWLAWADGTCTRGSCGLGWLPGHRPCSRTGHWKQERELSFRETFLFQFVYFKKLQNKKFTFKKSLLERSLF